MSTPDPRVRQIAADIFGLPPEQVSAETSPETLVSWDSLQHLQFVLALEEAFGLELEPEQIEQLRSVGEAEAIVAAAVARSPLPPG